MKYNIGSIRVLDYTNFERFISGDTEIWHGENIIIPEGLKTIPRGIEISMKEASYIRLPNSLKEIYGRIYLNGAVTIDMPNSIEYINNFSFCPSYLVSSFTINYGGTADEWNSKFSADIFELLDYNQNVTVLDKYGKLIDKYTWEG